MNQHTSILLLALNARYAHSSFGLRYLKANMGELRGETVIKEFTINQDPKDICEEILKDPPKIIGLGIYIWNVKEALELAQLIKKTLPKTILILGGPEISYEWEKQEIFHWCDFIITGEADLEFKILCHKLLGQEWPLQKVIFAEKPLLNNLQLPYGEYSDEDIKNRVIYVEASRGCVYRCEFCLSSLDKIVRQFPLQEFLREMDILLNRGALIFKFIDRTFNLNIKITTQIIQFFLERYKQGLFLHFEMVPDRLPMELRELITRFPAGSLQFEVGIQTFNPTVSKNISRNQDYQKLKENLDFLYQHTKVHVHSDLIIGLPGETIESFAKGFDYLVSAQAQEIQVGILKRLRGTPIIQHDQQFEMQYEESAPYEILQNKNISFIQMQSLKRFAKYWNLVANSGHFKLTLNYLLILQEESVGPFEQFMKFSEFLFANTKTTFAISLERICELLFLFLKQQKPAMEVIFAKSLILDYGLEGKRKLPAILKKYEHEDQQKLDKIERTKLSKINQLELKKNKNETVLNRQFRHLN